MSGRQYWNKKSNGEMNEKKWCLADNIKKNEKYKRCLVNNIGTSRRLGPPAVSLLRPILLSLNQAPPRLPTALLSGEEPWQDQVLHSRRVVVLDSRRVVVCVCERGAGVRRSVKTTVYPPLYLTCFNVLIVSHTRMPCLLFWSSSGFTLY